MTWLKAVAVQSANDATVCLAEYVAGSEEAFVQLMNQKAAELGMENTHFACCAGLDNEGHYSTARDIALMSRRCCGTQRSPITPPYGWIPCGTAPPAW